MTGQEAGAEPLPVRYGLDVAERWSCAELPRGGGVPYHAPKVATSTETADAIGLSPVGVA